MASGVEPAAIQRLIESHGALSVAGEDLEQQGYLRNLALQVLHNLRYQHRWTQLKLHTNSPTEPYGRLQRPLLSGLPPRRMYIHPDEQIEHLKTQAEAKKNQRNGASTPGSNDTSAGNTVDGDGTLSPVLEWVLPTNIREEWSLSKMAATFDAISIVPPQSPADDDSIEAKGLHADVSSPPEKWRQTKRVLLATVDGDSTVVYYIVHDGIVKPRQN